MQSRGSALTKAKTRLRLALSLLLQVKGGANPVVHTSPDDGCVV